VTEDDLVAYAYDEAPPDVVQHVQGCPACARSADEYRQLQQGVGGVLYRFDCPASHTLGEYHLQLLPPDERASIAAHLAECPICAEEVRVLRRFLADEPPPAPAGMGEQLKRIIATLVQPGLEAAYATVRGGGEAPSRIYRAGDMTITISLEESRRHGRLNLTGQIWREDVAETLAGRTVSLVAADESAMTAVIGDLGDFLIDEVTPSLYRLEIQLMDSVVVVENLRVDR
jgi:hypothetical protein